jgi:hypothetical protein
MWEDRKKQELKEAAIGAKTPSKDCDRSLFSNSHLSSHAFFVDSIEKTYNYDQVDPPLSISLHLYVVPVILW